MPSRPRNRSGNDWVCPFYQPCLWDQVDRPALTVYSGACADLKRAVRDQPWGKQSCSLSQTVIDF